MSLSYKDSGTALFPMIVPPHVAGYILDQLFPEKRMTAAEEMAGDVPAGARRSVNRGAGPTYREVMGDAE